MVLFFKQRPNQCLAARVFFKIGTWGYSVRTTKYPDIIRNKKQCGWRESNPHARRHQILSLARLPIPPHPHFPAAKVPLFLKRDTEKIKGFETKQELFL